MYLVLCRMLVSNETTRVFKVIKALSFSFDGDSSTTAIENVTRQEDAAVQTDGFVYNLSRQRVGTRNNMSNLSSGIYIVAGKKVVVK